MAGNGPPPNPNARRRNAPRVAPTTVVEDDELRGPDLPDDYAWPSRTVQWWQTWRKSAQSQTFTDTDWDFLLDTAFLHAEYALGNMALAAELRLRVSKYGATPEDRLRLRLTIEPPAKPTPAAVPAVKRKATARTQRLLQVVVDGQASG